jgi:hypothetical protein
MFPATMSMFPIVTEREVNGKRRYLFQVVMFIIEEVLKEHFQEPRNAIVLGDM